MRVCIKLKANKSVNVQISHVSVNWSGVNKLVLHDPSPGENQLQFVGGICMLAVSNTLMLVGCQEM